MEFAQRIDKEGSYEDPDFLDDFSCFHISCARRGSIRFLLGEG
jgi:hypothetical protein